MVMRSNVGGKLMSHQHMRNSAHLFNKRHARKRAEYIPLNVKIALGFVCLLFIYMVVTASGVIAKVRHHKTKDEIGYKDTLSDEVQVHETIDKNKNLQLYAHHALFADGSLLMMDDTKKNGKQQVYNLKGTIDFHGHLTENENQDPQPDVDANEEALKKYSFESKLGIADSSMAKETMQLTLKKSELLPKNVTGVADWFDEDDYRKELKVLDWDTILAEQRKLHTSKASNKINDNEMVMRYVYSMREPLILKKSPAKEWESVKTWTDGPSIQKQCQLFVEKYNITKHQGGTSMPCQLLMSHKLDNFTNFLEDEDGNNSSPYNALFIKEKGYEYNKQTTATEVLRKVDQTRNDKWSEGDKDVYREYRSFSDVFTEGMAVAKNTFVDIFKKRMERVRTVVRPKSFYGPLRDLKLSQKLEHWDLEHQLTDDAKKEGIDHFKKPKEGHYDFTVVNNADIIMKYFQNEFKKDDTVTFWFMMSQTFPEFYRTPRSTDAGDKTYSKPLEFTDSKDRTHFTVANVGSSGETTRSFSNRIIAPLIGKSTVAIWTSGQWSDLVMFPTWHKSYPSSQIFKREDSGIYNSCVKKADAGPGTKVQPYSVVKLEPGDVLYIPPLWSTRVLCDNKDGGYNTGACINLGAEVAMPKMVFNHADDAYLDTDIPEANIQAAKGQGEATMDTAVDFSRNYNRYKKTATESCLDITDFSMGLGSCFEEELLSTGILINQHITLDIQRRCFLSYGSDVSLDYAKHKVAEELEKHEPFSIYNVFNGLKFMGSGQTVYHQIKNDIDHMSPEELNMWNIEVMQDDDRGQHVKHKDEYSDKPIYYDPLTGSRAPFQKVNSFLRGDTKNIWKKFAMMMDEYKEEYFPDPIINAYQTLYNVGNWKLKTGYEKGDVTNGYQELDPIKKREYIAKGYLKEIDMEVTRTFPCERAAEAAGYALFNYVKKMIQFYPEAGDATYELPESAKKRRRDPDTGIRAVFAPVEDAEKLARKLLRATAQRYATETSGVLNGIRTGYGCLPPEKKECFHFKRDISPEYRTKIDVSINEAVIEALREYKRLKRILVQQRYHVLDKDKVAKTAAYDPEIVEDTWVDVDDYEDDGALDEHFGGIVGSYLSDFVDNIVAAAFNTPIVACTFLSCLSIADNDPPPPEDST